MAASSARSGSAELLIEHPQPHNRGQLDEDAIFYLRARGLAAGLTRQFRDAYWLAGACNAFAGALQYHLAVMNDPARPPAARATSTRAAADWLRIVRRADECLRQP